MKKYFEFFIIAVNVAFILLSVSCSQHFCKYDRQDEDKQKICNQVFILQRNLQEDFVKTYEIAEAEIKYWPANLLFNTSNEGCRIVHIVEFVSQNYQDYSDTLNYLKLFASSETEEDKMTNWGNVFSRLEDFSSDDGRKLELDNYMSGVEKSWEDFKSAYKMYDHCVNGSFASVQ